MYLNRFRIQRLYFLVDATGRNSNRNNVVIPRSWKYLHSLQIMIIMLNKLNYHCFVTIKKKTIPIRVNYRYQSLHMIFCLVTNIRWKGKRLSSSKGKSKLYNVPILYTKL